LKDVGDITSATNIQDVNYDLSGARIGEKELKEEKMIALYNFIPLYCPSCGTPTRLERVDNPMISKFKAH
jgi:hypothetical protein